MLKQQRLTLLTLSLVLLLSLQVTAAPTRLTIAHVNDVHGFLLPLEYEGEVRGGAPQLLALIEEIRLDNPNTLLLAGGDMITGSGDQYRVQWKQSTQGFRGILDLKVMNIMGFDAMVLGNHEFDHGKRWLTRLLSIPEFPILSANVVHRDLPPVGERDGSLLVSPYVIFEFEGLSVAVVGLTTSAHMQSAQVRVVDAKQALLEILPEVHARSDLVVVLSHLGMKADRELASALPGEIDVIIGGHSHTITPEPRFEGDTLIVQTGEYGINLGVLDLYVENGEVVDSQYCLVPIVENMPINEELQDFIEQSLILGEVSGAPLTWSNEERCPLGTLMADAMRWYTGTDFALVMSGVAEGTLPEGLLTAEEFFKVFWPYRARTMGPEKDLDEGQLMMLVDNSPGMPLWALVSNSDKLESIVVLELTAIELSELLAKGEAWHGTEYFLQVSSDLKAAGDLGESDRIYRVAVNLGLALADGEYGLYAKSESFEITKVEVFEAVIHYVEETF